MNRNIKLCCACILIAVFVAVTVLVIGCADKGNGEDTTEYIYVPEVTTTDGVLTPEQVGEGICFLNSFAKVGVELVCHGYPADSTYALSPA